MANRAPQFGAASARRRTAAMRRVLGSRPGALARMNAEEFSEGLRRLEDKFVTDIAKQAQVRLASLMHKNLVEGTPVLTGRARHNWNVSVGTPDTSTTTDVAGVQYTGDPYTETEKERMAEARSAIFAAPDFPVLYITNALFYVPWLDMGTSQKAPDGIMLVAYVKTLSEAAADRQRVRVRLRR